MTMTLIYLPMNLPMECLTTANILEQSLPVIEFDKKSNSIFLVFVKLFKTQNEISWMQETFLFMIRFYIKLLAICSFSIFFNI
jgi:hypothetical protein